MFKETSLIGVAKLCCVFSKNYFLDHFRFFIASLLTCIGFTKHSENLDDNVIFLINVLKQKNLEIEALKTCKLPLHSPLLKTSKYCEYYAGATNLSLFQNLYDFIVPVIHRRWHGVSFTSKRLKQQFCKLPKSMGPARKIHSKDEFSLLLMRLQLGLGEKDLAG